MTASNQKCVDLPVRFSQSKLWEIQRNYFKMKGVEAWTEDVPFYITSNLFIAERYALWTIHLIKDLIQRDPTLKNETFYILEIGCGTGKFSFYFLTAFEKLCALFKLEALHYCYIASDVADKNIEYCKTNVAFSTAIQEGKIDFACVDVVHDKDFFLVNKQKFYSELKAKTPLVVITNYIFDCLETDFFEYKNGNFEECQVGINSRYNNFNVAEGKYLNELKLEYKLEKIDINTYYDEPILNEILKFFQEKYHDIDFHLAMPIGALEFIKTLNTLTHNNFFIIAGDLGVSEEDKVSLSQIKNEVGVLGCFYFPVNFIVISEYIKRLGGDSLLSNSMIDFKVNAFSQSILFDQLVDSSACFKTLFKQMAPKEYCVFLSDYRANAYRMNYRSLMTFLKISEYDPDAYMVVHDRLLELCPSFTVVMKQDFEKILQKIQDNIYPTNIGSDIYNLLGIMHYSQDNDAKAIELFKQSIKVFDKKSLSYPNLGVVYEKVNNPTHAIEAYQQAIELDKNNKFAKRRLNKLLGKFNFYWAIPLLKIMVVCSIIAVVLRFSK